MAEGQVNAGDVMGRLVLDISQWTRGLQEATARHEAFQRQLTQMRMPDLRVNTSTLQQSLSQAESLYQQFHSRLASQQQQLAQRLGAPPGWMQQGARILTPGGATPPTLPLTPPDPDPQQKHANFWERLGQSILRFRNTWGVLFGTMGRDVRAFGEIERGLGDGRFRAEVQAALAELPGRLGGPGASARAANAMLDFLSGRE